MPRMIVISAHLDDAVFSCGSLIAASTVEHDVVVVTVLAGYPDDDSTFTHFDRAAGYESAVEHVLARQTEDRIACALLGASCHHLDLLDSQYEPDSRGKRQRMHEALLPLLESDSTIVTPYGIRHIDHVAVAKICRPHAHWLYDEIPSYVLWPETIPANRADPDLVIAAVHPAKRSAVEAYRSQLQDGSPGDYLFSPEVYRRGPRKFA